MQSFRDFIQPPWLEAILSEQMAPASGLPYIGGSSQPAWEKKAQQGKPWKAKRKDVVDFWQQLKPNLPLQIKPIDPNHRGTRFQEDGLRITGSPEFINSVLSRIKDFLTYDTNPATKLDVEYRQIENQEGELYNKPVFVAYVHVLRKTGGKRDWRDFSAEKPKEIKPGKLLKPANFI